MKHKKIPQTDYAYCAGYIDGDGCFHIGFYNTPKRRTQKPITSVVVSSVNTPVLFFFKNIFGGSINCSCKEHGNNKAVYQYVANKKASLEIVKQISKYLVEKREECALLWRFLDNPHHSFITEMKIIKDTFNIVSKYHVKEFKRYSKTVKPTEEDFAYLAGFIDSECCLTVGKWKPKNNKNFTYKIVLVLNNTKAPVFKWLIERFGGGLCFINRVKSLKARKNQLLWRLSGRQLFNILHKIHPFLKHKKPVCEELIKLYETTLPNGGARHTEAFRTAYAAILIERDKIVSKVHKLNLKGIQTT